MRPFVHIAIDGFGPMKLSNGSEFYGLVSTCLITRAVCFQILRDNSGPEAVFALTNMFRETGFPSTIYRDNGKNFLDARNKFLKNFLKTPQDLMAPIQWKVVPPYSPWFNGSTERAVGIAKKALFHALKGLKSHFDAHHILKRAEFIVNSRPLLTLDKEVVTPLELWKSRSPLAVPSDSLHPLSRGVLSMIEARSRQFERIWRAQYLDGLRCDARLKKARILVVGQKLLVPTLLSKRRNWPMAEIVKLFPGEDGIVRVVDLLLDGNVYRRSVKGLIPLETPPPSMSLHT